MFFLGTAGRESGRVKLRTTRDETFDSDLRTTGRGIFNTGTSAEEALEFRRGTIGGATEGFLRLHAIMARIITRSRRKTPAIIPPIMMLMIRWERRSTVAPGSPMFPDGVVRWVAPPGGEVVGEGVVAPGEMEKG